MDKIKFKWELKGETEISLSEYGLDEEDWSDAPLSVRDEFLRDIAVRELQEEDLEIVEITEFRNES